jgi:hypothetical protein
VAPHVEEEDSYS